MKLILTTLISYLLALAVAQDSLVPVPPGFKPTAVTVTNTIGTSPASVSPRAGQEFAAFIVPPSDTPLSKCGPSITCQKKPELIEITTKYPSTTYVTIPTTTVHNTTVTNTYVDIQISVTSRVIAHEGICTTVQEVTAKEPLTIPVVQVITQTDWYLNWTTIVEPSTVVVNVTERHACTSSMPPTFSILAGDQSSGSGLKDAAAAVLGGGSSKQDEDDHDSVVVQ